MLLGSLRPQFCAFLRLLRKLNAFARRKMLRPCVAWLLAALRRLRLLRPMQATGGTSGSRLFLFYPRGGELHFSIYFDLGSFFSASCRRGTNCELDPSFLGYVRIMGYPLFFFRLFPLAEYPLASGSHL